MPCHPRRLTRRATSVRRPHALHPSFATLQLPCTFNAVLRIWDRLEPWLRDRLVAIDALAIRSLFHATQGLIDQLESTLLVLDQAQCEFLVVVVRSQVGQVQKNI